jgi:nucleoside 2-deoxyribosyltransferase
MNPYSPLKVYVAARWDDRDDALLIKDFILKAGLICTSTWLTPHDDQSMDSLKQSAIEKPRQRAIKDFEDIDACDVYLVYSPKKSHRNGTGGKHVEMGYAMAKGKPCVLVGERENIFHYHPTVRVVDGVANFLKLMEIE